ncbi:fibrinogen C domain-containing protein 1-like [Seriola lalandi dorsalis]|uniref:fibrinogen C domain-containing protein 1-like n=1 Tax=Seriola lalandi dorsalis TaxID=1841481 RepID=UPI000C6F8655|nr:fibrinogen C domain-containing protein 1-like [Seriola lalandi dorsalis]
MQGSHNTQVKMKSLVRYFGLILAFLFSCTGQAEGQRTGGRGTDCTQIKTRSPQASSGVYAVQPPGVKKPFKVYCEMRADGGWTVFQRRSGQAVSFNRKWAAYKNGFGNLTKDHWLGLKKVFSVAKDKTKKWTLRVDLWDHEGGTAFAEYRNFRLGNEKTAFKLNVGKYSGNAGTAAFLTAALYLFSLFLFYAQINIGWASGLHWRTWRPPAPYSAKASRLMIKSV